MRKSGASKPPTTGERVRERLGLNVPRVPTVWRETPEERAALIIQEINRRHAANAVPRNPYQSRFYNFWTHCVWTMDEARAGLVKRVPTGIGRDGKSWDNLWLDEEHLLLTRRLLFFEKSRRVMASWLLCAFDVWLAAGGQDPRWPVLMGSDRNRQVVLAARKEQGYAGSHWFIQRRIQVIVEQAEAHGIGEMWGTSWPSWEFTAGEASNSAGGAITGVPQGSDQLRGGGATALHFEELAFWEQAKAAIGGSIPTLQGGGHAYVATTPQGASFAKSIRDGELRSHPARERI